MINLNFLPELPFVFMMIFARIGTTFMFIPGLGDRLIPSRVRIALAVTVTLVLYPLLRANFMPVPTDLYGMVRGLGHELLIGLMMGICTRMATQSMQIAGVIIAQQTGLGFATAVDPSQQEQSLVVSNFLVLFGAMLVLVSDLHHLAIAAVVHSYEVFNFNTFMPTDDSVKLMIQVIAGAFHIAIQISAPFLVFGLVLNVGLALVARVMPQMQVFQLGLPLTITLGFILLLGTISIIGALYVDHITQTMQLFMAL